MILACSIRYSLVEHFDELRDSKVIPRVLFEIPAMGVYLCPDGRAANHSYKSPSTFVFLGT